MYKRQVRVQLIVRVAHNCAAFVLKSNDFAAFAVVDIFGVHALDFVDCLRQQNLCCAFGQSRFEFQPGGCRLQCALDTDAEQFRLEFLFGFIILAFEVVKLCC